MYTLFIVPFKDVRQAENERQAMRLTPYDCLESDRMVSVERDSRGIVSLHHGYSLTSEGAITGGLWGSVVGLLLLNPLLGFVAGASVGAGLGVLGDSPEHEKFLRELAGHLVPGASALCIFVQQRHVSQAKMDLGTRYRNTPVLTAALDGQGEEQLRALLDKHIKSGK